MQPAFRIGWRRNSQRLVDAVPDGDDWAHEIKLHGYRMHVPIDRGTVRLMTRTDLDWTAEHGNGATRLAGRAGID
jgi:ATP-dependent DNA ligase